jgi:2-C-methyl-D-erythritol 4-phosphate cytidylyltransferase
VVPEIMAASFKKKYKNSNFIITGGGRERFDSVKNGLALLDENIKFVAVHDAARPLIDKNDILAVLSAAKKSKAAAIAAEKTKDTIKTVKNGFVKETLDRSMLWNVQTPQIFEANILKKAYSENIPDKTTDDSQLIERLKIKIAVTETMSPNFKITSLQDFEAAKNILSKRKSQKCV